MKDKKITKNKLQSGDLVVVASGEAYIVLMDRNMLISKTGWRELSSYSDKLEYKDGHGDKWEKDYFITDIYRYTIGHGWSWITKYADLHFIPAYIKE